MSPRNFPVNGHWRGVRPRRSLDAAGYSANSPQPCGLVPVANGGGLPPARRERWIYYRSMGIAR